MGGTWQSLLGGWVAPGALPPERQGRGIVPRCRSLVPLRSTWLPPPAAAPDPPLQLVLSDIMASMKLHHPYMKFSFPKAPRQDPHLQQRLLYNEARVRLQYPPEWRDMTVMPEELVVGFNLSIHFLNGTWDEKIGGGRFPPQGKFTKAFVQVSVRRRVIQVRSARLGPIHGELGWYCRDASMVLPPPLHTADMVACTARQQLMEQGVLQQGGLRGG